MTLESVMSWISLVTTLTSTCQPPIDAAVILAIIYRESRGDPNAINPHSGATGLMQVMPREANPKIFGDRPTQEELLDPETNITWGIRILSYCLREGRSLKDGLYYYSGGPAWKSVSLYEERYWRPFLRFRLQIAVQLRETKTDG